MHPLNFSCVERLLRPSGATQRSWKDLAIEFERSSSSFSPLTVLDILDKFREDYQQNMGSRDKQRTMINEPSLMKVISTCIKEISSFTSQDICRLIHITTIGIQWRDSTLLRGLEPTILERMSGLSTENLIDCIEAFTALRCGSRPFWEAAISAVTNMDLNREQLMRVVRTVESSGTAFYKPVYVLQELQGLVFRETTRVDVPLSNSEIRDLIGVYTRWNKALKSEYKHFVSRLLARLDFGAFDPGAFADILSTLADGGKCDPEEIKPFAQRTLQQAASHFDSSVNVGIVIKMTMGMSKLGTGDKALYEKMAGLIGDRIARVPIAKLVSLYSIFSKYFGLVNPVRLNENNFGPSAIADEFMMACESKFLAKLSRFSVREVARIMQSAALARRGSPELWSGLTTVLSQSLSDEGSETVSPEEVWGLLFAVSEMNLSLPGDLAQQLIVVTLERIHLLKNFNSALFFASTQLRSDPHQQAQFLQQILQLMDLESVVESTDPSVVLANLSLRHLIRDNSPETTEIVDSTNIDVHMYFESCRSVIATAVLDDIQTVLQETLQSTVTRQGDIADYLIPEKQIAVLVSSPVQVLPNGGPSGTAILRHIVVEQSLPGWQVINLSAVDWIQRNQDGKIDLILSSLDKHVVELDQPVVSEAVPTASEPEDSIEEKFDLSPFVRKDRRAAHRKRAPPSDELPWVSTVLTLRRGRRKFRKNIP